MDFRPLTLAELLDRSFTLYRRHLWLFVGVMAIPSVFALAAGVISEYLGWVTRSSATATADDAASFETALLMGGLVGGMLLVMLVYVVVYMVALGATTLAVSEIYVGREVTIGQVYGRMRGRLGSLIWLMCITGFRVGLVGVGGILLVSVISGMLAILLSPIVAPLILLLGMIPIAVLCVYMMLRYGLAVPTLVLEDLGGGDAVRRSIALTKGHLWRVLVLGICATVIAYAAILLFQAPFLMGAFMAGPETTTAFWLNLAGAVFGTIGTTFTGPIMIIGLALLYYDVRIRKEGLDLQLMLAAIDGQRGAPAPSRV